MKRPKAACPPRGRKATGGMCSLWAAFWIASDSPVQLFRRVVFGIGGVVFGLRGVVLGISSVVFGIGGVVFGLRVWCLASRFLMAGNIFVYTFHVAPRLVCRPSLGFPFSTRLLSAS